MRVPFREIGARHALLPGAAIVAAMLTWGGGAFSGENTALWTVDQQSWELAMADALEERADRAYRADRADRAEPVILGQAPWICTPSGFGQTASCFRRSEFKLVSND